MRRPTIVLFALFAVACGTSSPSEPSAPIDALPRALTAAEGEVVQRSNRFAFELMRRAAAPRDKNAFVSPLSVSMALGLTMNGAANATLDSMRATLGFAGMPMADINAGYRGLIDLLRGLDPSTDMRVANSVWFRQEMTPDADFVATAQASFDAVARGIDFTSPGAPGILNDWANEATNGRITKVIDEISDEAVMFLMNAIYFKSKWVQQFNKADTRAGPFAAAYGGEQSVPMMRRTKLDVRMHGNAAVQVAELSYGNSAFVMDLVLPARDGDISTLLDTLSEAQWDAWVAALQPREIALSMPRFRLSYTRMLNEDLKAMGMSVAFINGVADFSQLFEPNAKGPYLSFVKHDTFLDVNEEGTEAAAVTTVGVELTSAPPSFDVDRPFLLVLRERFSGTILFMGKILRIPS